jgi:hypothetical protein
VTLGAASLTVGGSTSITWSAVDATGCTASGSWSGALATNGTQTLKPTAAGTDTYTLTCANATGSSAVSSATLTVAAAATSSSHGGGGLNVVALLGLGGISIGRILRLRRRMLG